MDKLHVLLEDIEVVKAELSIIEFVKIKKYNDRSTDILNYDIYIEKLLTGITELKNIVSTEHKNQLRERMELLSIKELTSLKNLCNNKTL